VPFVASLRLAERDVRAGDVEDVVDDLEQDPELGGERTEVRQCSGAGLLVS